MPNPVAAMRWRGTLAMRGCLGKARYSVNNLCPVRFEPLAPPTAACRVLRISEFLRRNLQESPPEGIVASVQFLIQGLANAARRDRQRRGGANARPPPMTAAPASSGRPVSVLPHKTANISNHYRIGKKLGQGQGQLQGPSRRLQGRQRFPHQPTLIRCNA